ncbi:MAG TPA: Ku protein [Thermodesulfobacteriota bacterium]|nr:Ku protein [Thermodesulfobacteriota bacterium]
MARPIWKGHISFGLVSIPITLYSAEKRFDLHFKLLDSRDKAKIRYSRINEVTGEEVPWDQIVKGYEYDDDKYVLIDEEEFKKVAVEATRTIEIEDFVAQDSIDYVYFDKPYFVVPDKKNRKGYVLLREVLGNSGKVGIARVVIHTREYLSALFVMGDVLVLELLRFEQELRKPEEFELPEGSLSDFKVTKKEVELAEKLVEAMTVKWQPEKYQDEYRAELMEWIQKKAKSGGVEVPPENEEPEEEGARVIDMMELLKKSVEGKGGGGKSRAKTTASRKKKTSGAGKKTG